MIAVDTSSLSAFFEGSDGADVVLVRSALMTGEIRLPPAVLTEILSDPTPPRGLRDELAKVALLEIFEGYWERAGNMRRTLVSKRRKAKVAHTLIAQSCLDHDVLLITRDPDFSHFAKYCRLKLAEL